MRIHSNIISKSDIVNALAQQVKAGRVGDTVGFAVLTEHGSRTHKNAYEVQLGSSSCESFLPKGLTTEATGAPATAIKRASRRRARNNNVDKHTIYTYAPTWHEWGHFIAALFNVDQQAKIGIYDGFDSFEYQTGTQHRSWREVSYALNWNARAYDFMDDLSS